MEDQTSTVTKTETTVESTDTEYGLVKDSQMFHVSVRALIAFILVVTVCLIAISYAAIDIMVSINTKSLTTFTIPEPLYSGFMVAIGAYLGKAVASKATK